MKWTKEDDIVLVSYIFQATHSGSSLIKAYKLASFKLGRSISACESRWQKRISKNYDFTRKGSKDYISPIKFSQWLIKIASENK